MLVMGSHGRGVLRNLVLGSVATRVFAACTVPVLVIR
ncbi:MAG: universal stress protein [Betaproteobacteria bacterium]|nr:universal stress protein [Betaproteobacteria bacterium]